LTRETTITKIFHNPITAIHIMEELEESMAMPTYAVNASILLTDRPLLERPAAVRAAGFTALEFWWPFAEPVPADVDVDRFVASIRDAGVALTGLNFFAGDMAAGDRGVLSQPNRSSQFTDNIDVALGIGEQLGCTAFNALYGLRTDDAAPEAADELAMGNLDRAARAADRIGGTILIEPVSGSAGFPLLTAADALAVIDRVRRGGAPNIGLLADFYHLAVNGDDVGKVIAEHVSDFAHVQIADAPGRGAPGTGELPLADWIAAARAGGYTGPIGLEYKSADADPFAWLPTDQRSPR
jgi:hydroxypyruvate isomerase